MCKETLEMMLCLNRKELETQVVMQCAPLLTGIKISNLLTTDQNNRIHTARLFSRTPVSCFLPIPRKGCFSLIYEGAVEGISGSAFCQGTDETFWLYGDEAG